jgi:hypothetical protein
MSVPEFADLATFVRSWAQVPDEEPIRPDTQFERDLGITGDDGGDLLLAVEKHFSIPLRTKGEGYRKAFRLEDNEYLFNSEGFPIWELLPFAKKSVVRAFTVGELHAAMVDVVRPSA